MKRIFPVIAAAAMSWAGTAVSAHAGQTYLDDARVIRTEPVYETVEYSRPERECWIERVAHRRHRHDSYTGTIAGGILGGVVGNQFGSGGERTALTVAGTLLGASIGHDINHRNRGRRAHTDTVTHCEIVDRVEQREQLVGYRVEYRYEGQTFVTRTREHPGRYIRIRVNVDPVDRGKHKGKHKYKDKGEHHARKVF